MKTYTLILLAVLAGCNTRDQSVIPEETGLESVEDTGDTDDTGDTGDDSNPVGDLDTDDDNDGFTENEGDCNDGDEDIHPDADEVPYDGIDNDCDALTPDDDLDGDGYGIADDCDDTDVWIHPSVTDFVGNGVDDNCDGVDGTDADGDTYASVASGGDDCDDGESTTYPGAPEIWYDGVDQQCDGVVEDFDQDGDGYDSDAHGGTDCDDLDATLNPGNVEDNTNGVDDNCNGLVDSLRLDITMDWTVYPGFWEFVVEDGGTDTWRLEVWAHTSFKEAHTFSGEVGCALTGGGFVNCTGTSLSLGKFHHYVLEDPDGNCWIWEGPEATDPMEEILDINPSLTACTQDDPTAW